MMRVPLFLFGFSVLLVSFLSGIGRGIIVVTVRFFIRIGRFRFFGFLARIGRMLVVVMMMVVMMTVTAFFTAGF